MYATWLARSCCAQRPPRDLPRPAVRMVEHSELYDAVSVVVPCHNEEMNVEPLVEALLQHYSEYIHEMVLVDDNSSDGTRQVLEKLAAKEPRIRPVIRKPPGGVGRALRDGLCTARGKFVLLMDCDSCISCPSCVRCLTPPPRGPSRAGQPILTRKCADQLSTC